VEEDGNDGVEDNVVKIEDGTLWTIEAAVVFDKFFFTELLEYFEG
jgi:hypothetical protein